MKNYYIYKITNLINGKIYIGFTGNLKNRIRDHLCCSKDPKWLVHKAINKYGKENFLFEKIYESEDKKYTYEVMEPLFIAIYNSNFETGYGYNMDIGGKSDPSKFITKEIRIKIGNSLKGRKHTDEHKEKNRLASIGRIHSEETKKKISESHKGIKPKWLDNPEKVEKAKQKFKDNFEKRRQSLTEKNSRSYLINYSNKESEQITNLSKFCRENQYDYVCIYRVMSGEQKTHKNIIKVERL